MMKRWALWIAGVLTVLVGALYGVNALILFMVQPVNVQAGDMGEFAERYDGVQLIVLDDLKSGGVGNLAMEAMGYVNVLSSEQVIYVDRTVAEKSSSYVDYFINHEYAHVAQKKLIAQEMGGYPSVDNPWFSMAYYAKVLELNSTLDSLMPVAEGVDDHSAFDGLEKMADCAAQSPENADRKLEYVGHAQCNYKQKWTALAVEEEIWPGR